ncbi:RNA polymerase sigma factor [Gabonibacter chumensis]|uniref:RNA polymerase sigma factor n=1 Tax=Gabonibacter chumensis TaxID=2972474 RepID=UPI002573E5EA|nr:RNA polymerase sigma-70 factor [Gabonibacter chumensis]MCR9013154.1 RNA polymerase sigma-70 factor [Gabonibacter chumensis]
MTESILYEAIRGGDIDAFGKLFEELYPSMCRIAMKFVANKTIAEDIAQEAFVRLWEKRTAYDSIPNLKTFLYVSVKNLCFNHLRDKKETIEYTSPEVERQEILFHNRLIEEETYRILTQAIEALPPQSAKIMKLTLEGKQNKEISTLLDISVNTVKTLKYNALDSLKNNLKDYFYILLIILSYK